MICETCCFYPTFHYFSCQLSSAHPESFQVPPLTTNFLPEFASVIQTPCRHRNSATTWPGHLTELSDISLTLYIFDSHMSFRRALHTIDTATSLWITSISDLQPQVSFFCRSCSVSEKRPNGRCPRLPNYSSSWLSEDELLLWLLHTCVLQGCIPSFGRVRGSLRSTLIEVAGSKNSKGLNLSIQPGPTKRGAISATPLPHNWSYPSTTQAYSYRPAILPLRTLVPVPIFQITLFSWPAPFVTRWHDGDDFHIGSRWDFLLRPLPFFSSSLPFHDINSNVRNYVADCWLFIWFCHRSMQTFHRTLGFFILQPQSWIF